MDLTKMNERQLAAIKHTEGPLLVVAGAGSGKTRVITNRIAYLIGEKGVRPWNILALTFTNKAASEMKSRIFAVVGEAAEGVWAGTFHSISSKILRRHAEVLGYSSNFLVYDSYDQKALVKKIMKALEIDDKKISVGYALSEISKAKNLFMSPSRYLDAMAENEFQEEISEIYKEYNKALKESNAMDFDDLILKVIELFEASSDILDKYARQFEYIHVDEYQDTNGPQYRLVKLLSSVYNNVCVVGDQDQSIYSWRGADIRNIKAFTKDFEGASIVMLEQNYRSTGNILKLANSIIANNEDRLDKKLWTSSPAGPLINYYYAKSGEDETYFIASEIKKKRREGYKLSDFAILYRSNSQSSDFEKAFVRENLPYKIIGGLKFYERKEIKDLHAYLRLVDNPSDAISGLRIINEPKRGIGNTSLDKLMNFAAAEGLGFMEAIRRVIEDKMFNSSKLKAFSEFYDIIMGLHNRRGELKPSEILNEILTKTSYMLPLFAEPSAESRSRLENIEELVSQLMNREQKEEDISLSTYLEEISLLSDQDEIEEDGGDRILLMTLHSAKGLEFKVVFLVGLEENIFPSYYAMEEGTMDEERRLCYVGVTRAMEELYVSHAEMRYRFGQYQFNKPSIFLKEMPPELLNPLSEEERGSQYRRSGYNNASSSYNSNSSNYSNPKKPPVMEEKTRLIDEVSNSYKPKGIKTKMASGLDDFAVGAKVKHRMHGKGTIIKLTPREGDVEALVAFDARGVKRIMLASGSLQLLS